MVGIKYLRTKPMSFLRNSEHAPPTTCPQMIPRKPPTQRRRVAILTHRRAAIRGTHHALCRTRLRELARIISSEVRGINQNRARLGCEKIQSKSTRRGEKEEKIQSHHTYMRWSVCCWIYIYVCLRSHLRGINCKFEHRRVFTTGQLCVQYNNSSIVPGIMALFRTQSSDLFPSADQKPRNPCSFLHTVTCVLFVPCHCGCRADHTTSTISWAHYHLYDMTCPLLSLDQQ